jgi:hypothetical protein
MKPYSIGSSSQARLTKSEMSILTNPGHLPVQTHIINPGLFDSSISNSYGALLDNAQSLSASHRGRLRLPSGWVAMGIFFAHVLADLPDTFRPDTLGIS